ncbi:MAG: DUF5658 family protein [Candidatus Pacebacteria bacterium]|nr:DUF5658 family protein [Candidatus Paceibacterota bacterium]
MEKIEQKGSLRSEIYSKRYFLSVAAFMLINAADILSTRISLDKGGVEGNPLAQEIVESDVAMIITKAIYVASTLFVLDQVSKKYGDSKSAERILLASNIFYLIIVMNNINFFLGATN